MTNENKLTLFCEQVFEFRYSPIAKVLDHRGTWAQQLAKEMKMEHWRITDNRLDVFDKGYARSGFVGFRNSGYSMVNPSTRNLFPEQAVKLIKAMFHLPSFDSQLPITRIGVRGRFCTSFLGDFEVLLGRYCDKGFTISEEVKCALNPRAEIIDVGIPVNFKCGSEYFNIISGPMKDAQIQQVFPEREVNIEVGLYFDIDYWKEPNESLECSSVCSLVSNYSALVWDYHARFRELIMGDN